MSMTHRQNLRGLPRAFQHPQQRRIPPGKTPGFFWVTAGHHGNTCTQLGLPASTHSWLEAFPVTSASTCHAPTIQLIVRIDRSEGIGVGGQQCARRPWKSPVCPGFLPSPEGMRPKWSHVEPEHMWKNFFRFIVMWCFLSGSFWSLFQFPWSFLKFLKGVYPQGMPWSENKKIIILFYKCIIKKKSLQNINSWLKKLLQC